MSIKTALRLYLILVRMVIIKKIQGRMPGLRVLYSLLMGIYNATTAEITPKWSPLNTIKRINNTK